ncbi:MAG: adenylosuccinate lyase [candidate division WOR-3 bacterium]|jgi:adenylosuccinate lyase
MIKRYLLPEIEEVWKDENKIKKWLLVELAVLEAQVEFSIIPKQALKIKDDLKDIDYNYLLKRQAEIEKEVEHDVIAFLMALEEISEYAKYLHYGLTSSDVIDTANALIIREALELIKKEYKEFIEILKEKAIVYKYSPIMGRTHGVYAEPTTIGLKFLNYYSEALRNLKRIEDSIEEISYGKISGAVGNYAFLSPRIEEEVMKKLNLKPEKISTQIIPRDRYAYVINNLVLLAENLERIFLEIRLLSRTEVGEFSEPFYEKQRGSSAMPHKRNPIRSERINGLVRLIRGYLIPIHENIALWHERDISHSSIERIILPDITSAIYYIIRLGKNIIKDLIIDEKRIKENMEKFGKYYLTQPFLLKLVQKGISRKIAYEWLKRISHTEYQHFENAIMNDSEIRNYLSEDEIKECLNWNYYKNVEEIYKRFGL